LVLSVRTVAEAQVPVAVATVTPATLPALAEQSGVAAILPNRPGAVATRLLEELRPILAAAGAQHIDHGGLTSLGGVVVDVPVAGVARLAAADQVWAILADQPLTRPDGR
jgi:hypothetical protein